MRPRSRRRRAVRNRTTERAPPSVLLFLQIYHAQRAWALLPRPARRSSSRLARGRFRMLWREQQPMSVCLGVISKPSPGERPQPGSVPLLACAAPPRFQPSAGPGLSALSSATLPSCLNLPFRLAPALLVSAFGGAHERMKLTSQRSSEQKQVEAVVDCGRRLHLDFGCRGAAPARVAVAVWISEANRSKVRDRLYLKIVPCQPRAQL